MKEPLVVDRGSEKLEKIARDQTHASQEPTLANRSYGPNCGQGRLSEAISGHATPQDAAAGLSCPTPSFVFFALDRPKGHNLEPQTRRRVGRSDPFLSAIRIPAWIRGASDPPRGGLGLRRRAPGPGGDAPITRSRLLLADRSSVAGAIGFFPRWRRLRGEKLPRSVEATVTARTLCSAAELPTVAGRLRLRRRRPMLAERARRPSNESRVAVRNHVSERPLVLQSGVVLRDRGRTPVSAAARVRPPDGRGAMPPRIPRIERARA